MLNQKKFQNNNLATFDDKLSQIEAINYANGRTDVSLKYLDNSLLGKSVFTTIEKILPVSLNTQILKELNFEVVDMKEWISYQYPNHKTFYIKQIENIFEFCARINIKISTFHELQNLFYSQFKYELPILRNRVSI